MSKRKRENPVPKRLALYEFDSRVAESEDMAALQQLMTPIMHDISENVQRYGIRLSQNEKGIGKICAEPIEAGELVGIYTGTVYNAKEVPLEDNGRQMTLPNSLVVNGFGPSAINAADCNHSCQRFNCRYMFVHDDDELLNAVVLETTRRVEAGEELLVDYGDEFFAKNGTSACLCDTPCPLNRFFA